MSLMVLFVLVLFQVRNINGLDAVCAPGVAKYASSLGLGFYYECQSGDDIPTLKECPNDGKWNRRKMTCENGKDVENGETNGKRFKHSANSEQEEVHGKRTKRSAMTPQEKPEILFEPVLGRTVSLGDLYDARRDLPLNGLSLWNEKEINTSKRIQHKYYSHTDFFAEESQNDRLAKLDIKAGLKLSFLGGLVEVEGSATYVKDQTENLNIVRFNMLYEATTNTESIPMSLRNKVTYTDVCKDILANKETGPTHVISSVEYGMKAIFIFQKQVKSYESKEEIGGSLRVVVKSIPDFKIEGSATIDVKGSMKETKETMEVKMYGDFIVDHSPTNYIAAQEVYKNLPKYLGTKESGYDQASPVNIQLTPIGEYCTEAQLVLAGISADLMTKATDIMEELMQVMLHVKTLETTFLANKFLDVFAILKLFRVTLDVYTIEVKTNLSQIIPAMRGGGGEERLTKLLLEYSKSAFQFDSATRFLQERERELNTINSLFDDVNVNIKIGDFTAANIAKALLHKPYVILYKFSVFSNIKVTQEYLKNKTIDNHVWYNNFTTVGMAGYNWREFKTFVSLNEHSLKTHAYFIQGSSLGDKLTQIYVFENGIELTSDFHVPKPPPMPKVIKKTYNSVTLILGKTKDIENKFITEVIIKHTENGNVENVTYTHTVPIINSAEDITVTIEMPLEKEVKIGNTTNIIHPTNSFKSAFQTSFGRGRDSDLLEDVRPLASSPPEMKPVDHIKSTSIKLSWVQPTVIPKMSSLAGYRLNITNENVSNTRFKGDEEEVTITNLEPATKFTASLEVWFSNWTLEGEMVQFDFTTIPDQPEKPSMVKIDKNSVTLQLVAKDEIILAAGATFKRYTVRFYKIDQTEMKKWPGTEQERDFQNNKVEISSLAQGTQYNFEYKIVSSGGTSKYSPPQLVETPYEKTELDKINQEVNIQMKATTNSIAENSKKISSQQTSIAKNVKQISHQQTFIVKNVKQISSQQTSIAKNVKQISSLDSSCAELGTDIGKNSERISWITMEPVLVHTDSEYKYYKVPVQVGLWLTSATVMNTCAIHGLKPQCWSTSHNDDNCVMSPGTDPSGEMAAILCNGNRYIWSCKHLVNVVFWYMKASWEQGSAWGMDASGNAVYGKGVMSTSAAQRYTICVRPI